MIQPLKSVFVYGVVMRSDALATKKDEILKNHLLRATDTGIPWQ